MRVLVCGSRHFTNYTFMCHHLKPYLSAETVIVGGARGTDRLAKIWAEHHSIPFIEFPAKWEEYGKTAGPIRNKQMLDEGKPDLIIAFLATNSRGTKNMIEQATKAGVPVKIVNI